MAKKNKGKRGPQGGRGGGGGGGEPVADAWLEEQRRLLEQYSPGDPAGGGGGPADAEAGDWPTASEAVIVAQQRLLDEAARGASSGTAFATASGAGGEVFIARRISFLGRKVPVLLQNRNGPCALLAVANGLLLRGTLRLGEDEAAVSSGDLVERLAKLCEALNARAIREDVNARESVRQVMGRLPKFLDGLVLNCRFGACSDFEYTADLGLFDLFGLNLYHSWVDGEVAEKAASWNALAEQLAVWAELRADLEGQGRAPAPEEEDALARGFWLEQWLEETRTQATPRGLLELAAAVRDREVCVLFRNNHFSTLYRPGPDSLCALLTDASIEDVPSAVWESIELDCGAGRILGADFEEAAGSSASAPWGAPAGGGDSDDAVASLRAELVSTVEEMGFSREQAEAGLAAVDWSSAEEAVEAILGACDPDGGGLAAAPRLPGQASCRSAAQDLTCPACGKQCRNMNGLLSHRTAKGH